MASKTSTTETAKPSKPRLTAEQRIERLKQELAAAKQKRRESAQKKVAILYEQLEALHKRRVELDQRIHEKKLEIVAAEAEIVPANDGVGIVPAPEPELSESEARPEEPED